MPPIFELPRRAVLAAGAALPLAQSIMADAAMAKPAPNQRLWYRQPAKRWEEALPIGNGRLGAMVFGRLAQERLQLNEDTLWAGSPYTPDNPNALAALPQVRELIAKGDYKAATDLINSQVMAKPLSQMAYGSLGDIFLNFSPSGEPSAYERDLNLQTAIATTTYTLGKGRFRRESFVSAPDQVVVVRLEAKGARIGFDLAWRGPRRVQLTPANYQGSATSLASTQATDWMTREDPGALQSDATLAADGGNAILITGRNESSNGIAAGLRYALRIQVICDGQVTTTATGLTVAEASGVTLLMSAATSYVSFNDVSGDPVARVRRDTEAASRRTYAELKRDHVASHQALYNTVSLDLGQTSAARQPTDVRVTTSETSDDPALAALYFQYARYLLISSSRPGTQPANLQGIWNESTNPPWGSKYTININTEMNYWPADPANLSPCVEPLLKMVEELAQTGARTAKTMYGARGWVAHHNTDLWRASAPIDGAFWGMWPCGGAWLCNTLWDHYDYTRDPAVLKRLYPLLAGASQFFLDTLVEDAQGRGLVTSPSNSPENGHPFGSSISAGPAMDRQILRDLFSHTLEAGRLLGQQDALLSQVDAARRLLPPDRVGAQGQFQEWLEDWDAQAPEQNHRHVSHLYAVYPSSQVNVRDTPDLIKAAQVTLNHRGDMATGWGTAWRLCLWARMGEGARAHSILKGLLGPQRTYPNLFDAHPPFQIDGNFGGAAGIMEMLLQSWGGEILLLPALPSDWPSGSVSGLKVRGGITVALRWAAGKLQRLDLKGPAGATLKLRHKGALEEIALDAGGRYNRRYT